MSYNFPYIFLLFFIYSSIGWFIEVIACFFNNKKIMKRGFLRGPYCPIYGFGSLIMIFLAMIYIDNPYKMYLMFVLYASFLEFIVSFILEKLFNARWWDYSEKFLNLAGRISLSTALLFGLLGLILVYFGNPFIVHILNMVPSKILTMISMFCFTLFVADIIVSVIILLKVKNNITLSNEDMTEIVDKKVSSYLKHEKLLVTVPFLKKVNDIFRRS